MAKITQVAGSVEFDQTISFQINVGTGADRAVAVSTVATQHTLTSATIDGVAVTPQQTALNANSKYYYLLYATGITGTGLITVSLTFSGAGGSKRYSAVSYDGIGSARGSASNAASNGSPSVTLTTVANDIAVVLGWDGDFGVTFSASAPATAFLTASLFGAEETAAGTSTVVDGTFSAGAVPWAAVGVALVPNGAASPIAFTGTVPAQTGTVGAAFGPLNLSTYFSGTLTPFVYSVFAGTLPTGLSLNTSTGVISGTPTTTVTASGIVIRGTDTAANIANSNAFDITISAVPSITTTPLKNNPGIVLANTLIPSVGVYKKSDMTNTLVLANQTSNASGQLFIQNAALVAGTVYIVVLSNVAGTALGVEVQTAVA